MEDVRSSDNSLSKRFMKCFLAEKSRRVKVCLLLLISLSFLLLFIYKSLQNEAIINLLSKMLSSCPREEESTEG